MTPYQFPEWKGQEGLIEIEHKTRILFLCTGNSCRSQMAEGWARHLKDDLIEPYSAGIEVHGLNQRAVAVMAKSGVDISGHESTQVDDYISMSFDFVITVCGHADENCPIFQGDTKVVHHGFDDPPKLAMNEIDEEKILGHYRRVRDEIRKYIETLPESL